MFQKISLFLLSFILLTGCSSTAPKPQDPENPLKKGVSQYYLGDVKVNLTLGHGGRADNEKFTNEQQLTENFRAALTQELSKLNILNASEENADASLAITIDYLRQYNIGGNALNIPKVSHQIRVFKDDQDYATRTTGTYLIGHNLIEAAKISAFKWGAEDELKDVQRVAAHIAKSIAAIGR